MLARCPAPGHRLPGNRLHLQDGPIDLVIGAEGDPAEVEAAYTQAACAFGGLLAALVAELPLLRAPVPMGLALHGRSHSLFRHPRESGDPYGVDAGAAQDTVARSRVPMDPRFRGDYGEESGENDAEETPAPHPTPYLTRFRHPVARAMAAACLPHAALWVTPMAAVAGAVADHVTEAMVEGRRLAKAWVNDGGDIAFRLAPGAVFELGLVTDLADRAPSGLTRIAHDSSVRGVATSGRQGRSLSRGIADAVTVLARSAAEADAAATLIANAVDLEDHPAILRRPACDLVPDSDLGEIPVVTAVGPLAPSEIQQALAAGAALAEEMHASGLIEAALLGLRGHHHAIPDKPNEETAGWS